MGFMIRMLFGNDDTTAQAWAAAKGKQIAALAIVEADYKQGQDYDCLRFGFADGSALLLFDDGQSCCESRYMHTDDPLEAFVGATLENIEGKCTQAGGEGWIDDHYVGCHEIMFIHITTSIGVFVLETHNEHNGYYGGFVVRLQYQEAPNKE
jgi:hypothetical protein